MRNRMSNGSPNDIILTYVGRLGAGKSNSEAAVLLALVAAIPQFISPALPFKL